MDLAQKANTLDKIQALLKKLSKESDITQEIQAATQAVDSALAVVNKAVETQSSLINASVTPEEKAVRDQILAWMPEKHRIKQESYFEFYAPIEAVKDITVGYVARVVKADPRRKCRCEESPVPGCHVFAFPYDNTISFMCRNCFFRFRDGADYGKKFVELFKRHKCKDHMKTCYAVHATSFMKQEG